MKYCTKKNRGFTLMEMLVALVVVSIGLLGVAGMQAHSLRHNGMAFDRTMANVLTFDILDRMRANRDQAKSPGFAYNLDAGDTPASADALAQQDLTEWVADLAATIPAGAGSIACAGATNTVCTITVQWAERGAEAVASGSGATTAAFVLSTEI